MQIYRAALDASPIAFCIMRRDDGRLIHVNARHLDPFGVSAGDLDSIDPSRLYRVRGA